MPGTDVGRSYAASTLVELLQFAEQVQSDNDLKGHLEVACNIVLPSEIYE